MVNITFKKEGKRRVPYRSRSKNPNNTNSVPLTTKPVTQTNLLMPQGREPNNGGGSDAQEFLRTGQIGYGMDLPKAGKIASNYDKRYIGKGAVAPIQPLKPETTNYKVAPVKAISL